MGLRDKLEGVLNIMRDINTEAEKVQDTLAETSERVSEFTAGGVPNRFELGPAGNLRPPGEFMPTPPQMFKNDFMGGNQGSRGGSEYSEEFQAYLQQHCRLVSSPSMTSSMGGSGGAREGKEAQFWYCPGGKTYPADPKQLMGSGKGIGGSGGGGGGGMNAGQMLAWWRANRHNTVGGPWQSSFGLSHTVKDPRVFANSPVQQNPLGLPTNATQGMSSSPSIGGYRGVGGGDTTAAGMLANINSGSQSTAQNTAQTNTELRNQTRQISSAVTQMGNQVTSAITRSAAKPLSDSRTARRQRS